MPPPHDIRGQPASKRAAVAARCGGDRRQRAREGLPVAKLAGFIPGERAPADTPTVPEHRDVDRAGVCVSTHEGGTSRSRRMDEAIDRIENR